MGVHYLVRNLEHICGRLPFKITFNTNDSCHMESDLNIDEYRQIGNGILKYIGIDGSVIIHSKIKTENDLVLIKQSAKEIVRQIIEYVEIIVIYFNIFNQKDKMVKTILLHFVIDGKPPCNKNRRKIFDEEGNETYKMDAYSLMPIHQKEKLHRKIIKYLKHEIQLNNSNNKYKIELLTNFNVNKNERGEGEIELYKVCQKLNEKYQQQNEMNKEKHIYKNVIVSSDSDLISLMLLHNDDNLVIISPINRSIYITNLKLITNALKFKNNYEIMKYILLHFIFFGSDYNLGLMSNPNNSKQKAILDAIANDLDDINNIGRNCPRKRKRKLNDDGSYIKNNNSNTNFLQKFKELLIYEAICAFMYYYDFDNGSKYLLNYSPRLYEKYEAKKYISLLNF